MNLPLADLQRAATEARGLAMDAVHACSSGHLGLPLGCAEIGAVLFGHSLSYDPAEPRWLNRDRFVLSAGHGSMFLYAWLHLAGYAQVGIDQVKAFRALGSHTPGHPENFETLGVECTTGPLGQGVANAVGIAASQKMAAARFNTAEHTLFDNLVVCLAGDGCLQEGVSAEASSFAGHNKLDNLVLVYDSNDVTLDAMADASQSEDTGKRYEAYGWHVQTVDGHDMAAFAAALQTARTTKGRPHLIIAKTLIGKGIPEVAGTAKAHGEGGAKFIASSRQALGLPENEHFFVSAETHAFFAAHRAELAKKHAAWQSTFNAWKASHADLAQLLADGVAHRYPSAQELLAVIPPFAADSKIATRKAGSDVLQPIAKALPLAVSGSADLYGSTLNYIAGAEDFAPGHFAGRNIRYGIREHAMAAIMNGFAYDGIFQASGATFLVFADYARPSIRIAALAKLPVVYIFTHDSIGVGEDGPTHQPVETVTGLRVIPNLHVIRPGDPEETAGAFRSSLLAQQRPHAACAFTAGASDAERYFRRHPPRGRPARWLHRASGNRRAAHDPHRLRQRIAACYRRGKDPGRRRPRRVHALHGDLQRPVRRVSRVGAAIQRSPSCCHRGRGEGRLVPVCGLGRHCTGVGAVRLQRSGQRCHGEVGHDRQRGGGSRALAQGVVCHSGAPAQRAKSKGPFQL
jgi:transketolase